MVGVDDDVWHLGDFAWRGHQDTSDISATLHGRRRLIIGNHDKRDVRSLPWAESPRSSWVIEIGGVRVYLTHAPRPPSGAAVPQYGHVHGQQPDLMIPRSLDVGADVHGYAPIAWPQVRQLLGV